MNGFLKDWTWTGFVRMFGYLSINFWYKTTTVGLSKKEQL
jgi:hypothetical protein